MTNSGSRRVKLSDFLSEEQIEQAVTMYKRDRRNFHRNVMVEILHPNSDYILAVLGQDTDMSYLAYVMEYIIGEAVGHSPP